MLKSSCCALALMFAGQAIAADSPASGAIEWQVMLEGKPVGHATWRWNTAPGAESWQESLDVAVVQAGRRSRLGYDYEIARAKNSEALRFERKVQIGETRQFDRGRIEAGWLFIESSSLSRRQREVALPPDVLLPFERMRRLSAAPSGTVDWFDFDLLAAVPAQVQACAGARPRCVRVNVKGADAPGEWRFDAKGRPEAVEFGFAHMSLTLKPCAGGCNANIEPVDLLSRLLVPSPVRIAPEESQRKLRYVISRRDGQAPTMALTGDQDFVFDSGSAFVTVCRNCFPREPASTTQLQESTRPTAWLQSGDVLYRRLAVRAGGDGEGVQDRMRRSSAVLFEKLRPVQSFVGLADAVQTLKIGKADCIGFAVALATLARAQGIPARIVIGMAYADRFSGRKDVFSPHAWVQAWDGKRWVSYDAALGDFDSTHIAFAVGDDPPALHEAYSQLADLRIERVGAVKEIE